MDINVSICGIKVTEEPCLEINACWVEKKKVVDSWAGRYNNPSSYDDYSSLNVDSPKYTDKNLKEACLKKSEKECEDGVNADR